MSGETEKGTTWLPNLVGGVSIWKLARDLNEPKFMDGRLLVPETEGSESLPTSVTWDVARLMPFAEAREKHASDLEKATQEFGDALSRVADEFRKESSGYHQYREAFTVPSIEADLGGHYFYDAAEKKLFAVNWGATPRALSGYQEFVFGWDRFGKAMAGAATLAAAKAAAAGKDPNAAAEPGEKKDDKKKNDEKKKDDKKRPIWIWLLLIALFIGILLLILYLLKSCEAENAAALADASADAQMDAADAADAASDAEAGADAGDSGDASADAGDAGKDGGDAGADAGKDGGKDAGSDAGATADDDDDDDEDLDDDGSGGGGGGSGGGGSGGGGGGGKKVTPGPAGGAKGGPHRVHVHPQAVEWRITSGWGKVSRTVQKGHRFDVYLGKGNTYDGVRVEYKDQKGAWHGF